MQDKKVRAKKTVKAPSESQIEESICQYLSYIHGGHVCKLAPSGFFNGKKMIKHRSKYIQRGMSDIFFWYKNKFYAFEVKNEREYKYAIKHYDTILNAPYSKLNEKKIHLKEQILFMEYIKRAGFVGRFVCSIEQVKGILGG